MGRIVLIPRMPAGMSLDLIFKVTGGMAIQASDGEIQAIKKTGVPVAELFPSGNEYTAAMSNLTTETALAAIETIKKRSLAALTPSERQQFGIP
jgi:hypothetical protein